MNAFKGRKQSPCYECNNRSTGCHSVCEKYRQYKVDANEVRNQINESISKQAYFKERYDGRREGYYKKFNINKVVENKQNDLLEIHEIRP